MAVPETDTLPPSDIVQGELILAPRKVHGVAHNAVIVPADGSPWFMEQFITDQQVLEYAAKFNLIIKRQQS